ncbi:MAG: hypothetical protein ACPG5R_04695 [Cognaticolwellia aestuarii]
MTVHNSIEILKKINKILHDLDEGVKYYAKGILTELLKEQSVETALLAFDSLEFPNTIAPRGKTISNPAFKHLLQELNEEIDTERFLSTSIRLISLGQTYFEQLKLHDKESTVIKVNKALQGLCEMDEDTFKEILRSWIAHCHYYFAEDELRIGKRKRFITNKHKELFGYFPKVNRRKNSTALNVTQLFKKNCSEKLSINPLSSEAFNSIDLIFVEGGVNIKSDNYKERYFYSQLNKLVDRYDVTHEDISSLRKQIVKKTYSIEIFEDIKGDGRLPNFILGCHQLSKQKQFLDEWAGNSALLEDVNVNLTEKAKLLLDKYNNQIDIYDTGFDLNNNEFPTFPIVIKSILSPTETNITSTFKPNGESRRGNNSDELLKLNQLRYRGTVTMIPADARRLSTDLRYWFELSLTEYLNKHPSIEQSFTDVINYIFTSSAYIYHGYWLAFLKALRDRSFVDEPPQHLLLMNDVLKEHYDSYFDDWVNSEYSNKTEITKNQLPKENNPFVIKPEQNNKWDNEKVSAC